MITLTQSAAAKVKQLLEANTLNPSAKSTCGCGESFGV